MLYYLRSYLHCQKFNDFLHVYYCIMQGKSYFQYLRLYLKVVSLYSMDALARH